MNVYYNKNGNLWKRGRNAKKLTPIPVQKSFLWEDREIFIPALYTGKPGVVMDVCIKIPVEDMADFFKKWSKERRLSLNSNEDYEQMEADNPCCIDFETELCLNETPLASRMWGSIVWYPKEVMQLTERLAAECAPAAQEVFDEEEEENFFSEEWENDTDAEKLMEAYKCDPGFCWYFCRRVYDWKKEPILSPREFSLVLKEEPVPVTTAYFTTNLSCKEKKVIFLHPKTKQEYTLILHKCEKMNVDFSQIGTKDVCYPCLCQTISYSISPKSESEGHTSMPCGNHIETPSGHTSMPCGNHIEIRDCANGDSPRKKETAASKSNDSSVIRESCGPTAFFVAGKTSAPRENAAVSSLYFQLPKEIKWRIIVQVKRSADLNVRFSPISYK